MSGGASGEAERRNTPETELDLTAGDQPPPPPGAQALPPAAAMVFEASLYRGPLPDPGTLREYDEVVPGCAKQIIDEWQSQTRHRHEQEAKMVDANVSSLKRGQLLAGSVAILAILMGGLLIYADKDAYGLVAMLAPLSLLVAAFVYFQIRGTPEKQEPPTPPKSLGPKESPPQLSEPAAPPDQHR